MFIDIYARAGLILAIGGPECLGPKCVKSAAVLIPAHAEQPFTAESSPLNSAKP